MLKKLSSLPVDPAFWLGKIFPYVPIPAGCSRRCKVIFSSVLALIFLFLCVPLTSVKNPYEREMRTFSPAEQAQEIYHRAGPKAAEDYIVFYQSLPNVEVNADLEKIKAEAEAHRGTLKYNIDEGLAAVTGGETHEDLANKIKSGMSLMPAAKVRKLVADGKNVYEHWQKFQNNENINTFVAGLDGAGLLLGIAGLVIPTSQPVTTPAQKAISPIRRAWNKISPKVKSYIFNLFKPVFAVMVQSDLMEFKRSDLIDSAAFYQSKKDQLKNVLELTKSAFAHLGPILALSLKDEPLTEMVMLNSQSPEELEINLELANRFTNEDMPILKFGGGEALRAAARLNERGEFDPGVLRAAMRYGPAGLNAVGHMPAADIIKGDFSSRRAYGWLQILLLVLYVPYACLAIIKMWRPELAHTDSVKKA